MQQHDGRIALILKDTAITLFAELLVLVAFFIFYRLLLDIYGGEDLGLYALSRRVIAFLIPIILLGLYDGMGRYLAVAESAQERSMIIIASFAALLTMLLLTMALLLWDRPAAAEFIFGSPGYADFILPFFVLVAGLSFHTFTHAALRGSMRIKLLNTLQLINLGVMPIFLVSWYQTEFTSLLLAMGVLHGFIALVPVVFLVVSGLSGRIFIGAGVTVRKLFSYSIPRILNGMVAAGLVALGPILATGHMSMTEVGYLALSFSLLVGVSSFVSPLGLVLLPYMSKAVAADDTKIIGEKLYLLIGSVIQMLLFACVQFLVFASFLTERWMGESFLPAVPVISIVFISILFYGFFVATRSILDAVSESPVNSINAMVALAFLFFSSQLGLNWIDIFEPLTFLASIFTLSMGLLAILTYRSLRYYFPGSWRCDGRHLYWGIILNVVLGMVAINMREHIVGSLVLFLIFEILMLAVYVWLLTRLKFDWVFVFIGNLPFGLRRERSV